MNIDLNGRRALVTGANSGIGQAIALALGEAGADVVVNYVTHPETADAVVAQLLAQGRRALALHADVSAEADVDAMFTQMDTAWGGRRRELPHRHHGDGGRRDDRLPRVRARRLNVAA